MKMIVPGFVVVEKSKKSFPGVFFGEYAKKWTVKSRFRSRPRPGI